MSFQERRETLERKHLTASALIKEVLKKQATQIAWLLYRTGYYFGAQPSGAEIIEEGEDGKSYTAAIVVWRGGKRELHGKIKFSNVRQGGGAFLERELPYETDREGQEALSMTCSNRGASDITRKVSREVQAGTVAVKTKQDQIHWDVNVGFSTTVGKTGTESTFGATATATLSANAGVGGEHTFGSSDESSETITRSVEDEFIIPANSKYKLVGTYDKISLRQDYRIYYPIDYDIEYHQRDFGASNYDVLGRFYDDPDSMIKHEGIDAFISAHLGHPVIASDDYAPGIKDLVGEGYSGEQCLAALEQISDKDNRMIVQRGTIEYNDASDISIDVYELGRYHNGELKL